MGHPLLIAANSSEGLNRCLGWEAFGLTNCFGFEPLFEPCALPQSDRQNVNVSTVSASNSSVTPHEVALVYSA